MNWIVLRPAEGVTTVPEWMDGRWYNLDLIPEAEHATAGGVILVLGPDATMVETTRTEEREDGAVATVWEVHP